MKFFIFCLFWLWQKYAMKSIFILWKNIWNFNLKSFQTLEDNRRHMVRPGLPCNQPDSIYFFSHSLSRRIFVFDRCLCFPFPPAFFLHCNSIFLFCVMICWEKHIKNCINAKSMFPTAMIRTAVIVSKLTSLWYYD